MFRLYYLKPDSIRVMGDKATARETMKNAGVPTVPGSDGLLQVCCWIINLAFKVFACQENSWNFNVLFCSYYRARKKQSGSPMGLVSL